MALEIGPPDRVPSEAEIRDLERQIGFRLPNRVRVLLPQLNGARAEPNVIKGPGDEDYGISRFENIEDIVDSKNAIDSGNPSDLLLVPFADDGCGDYFCVVAVDGPEKGAIYFVDHEIAGDDAFSRVAADLDELFEGAEPDIDTDDDNKATVVWMKPEFLELLKKQKKQLSIHWIARPANTVSAQGSHRRTELTAKLGSCRPQRGTVVKGRRNGS